MNTVFIRLSAQGAYLIFGFSRWALIRGGHLFEAGRLNLPFSFYLIYMYTFLRTYDDKGEVSVKVTGSKMLKNGLVVPGTFKTRTPNRAIATKSEREILRLKELCAHMDISVKTLRKIPTLS